MWLFTRAALVAQLYIQSHGNINYEDLQLFLKWAHNFVETSHAPVDGAWQYPPGAIYIFLLPLYLPWNPLQTYIGMFLLADLGITLSLIFLSVRNNSSAGVWVWVLGLPALGKLPLLRFDVVPTALAVFALTLPSGKWKYYIFGAIAGIGAAVKAWPLIVFLSVQNRISAKPALLASAITTIIILAGTFIWCDGSLSFIGNQASRALQIESVAATPWYIAQAVTGTGVAWIAGHGTLEIVGQWADRIASLSRIGMAVLGFACALWWLSWTRNGATIDPDRRAATGRDAAFTAILLYVVISPILSPQYLIWLIGLGAVAACSPYSLVRRPVAAGDESRRRQAHVSPRSR